MATIRFISGEAALANFIEGIRQQAVERLQVSGYNARYIFCRKFI